MAKIMPLEVEITSTAICAGASLGAGSCGTANYREIAEYQEIV
jgi:hypothetical protein